MKKLISTILCVTLLVQITSAEKPTLDINQSIPRNANEYFELGFNAANAGNYQDAVKNYSSAINADPNRIYFYYHRGLAYKGIGNKAAALTDFYKCLEMKPIAEAFYQIGVFKYEALDLMGAKVEFEKAKSLKEDVEKVNYYLGVIQYRMNNYEEAVNNLSRYTTYVKTNSDAFLYLAMAKVKQKKYGEVTPFLKMASLYNDNDWQLYLKMYEIYKEMGDKDNQLYNISMVIEMGQTKPEYFAIRAKLYTEMGDNMRAAYDLVAAKTDK